MYLHFGLAPLDLLAYSKSGPETLIAGILTAQSQNCFYFHSHCTVTLDVV